MRSRAVLNLSRGPCSRLALSAPIVRHRLMFLRDVGSDAARNRSFASSASLLVEDHDGGQEQDLLRAGASASSPSVCSAQSPDAAPPSQKSPDAARRTSGVPTPRMTEAQLKGAPRFAKRFYEEVAVKPIAPLLPEHQQTSTSFGVELDGKPLRTPFKKEIEIPSLTIAERVQAEWAGQENVIRADTMIYQALVCTALDQVKGAEAAVVERVQ